MRPVLVAALTTVLALAGCGDGDGTPATDLGRDLSAVAAHDLAPSGCPATPPHELDACNSADVCRYATDAGVVDHYVCYAGHWEHGDCPWGPSTNPPLQYDGCTRACHDLWGEISASCDCSATGHAVCCVSSGGGPPECGSYDGGS